MLSTLPSSSNTFGAGGTNGHVVLERYSISGKSKELTSRPFLYRISAVDASCLSKLAVKYAHYVQIGKPDLRDLAHSLLFRRSMLRYSRFLVADNHEGLVQKLRSNSDNIDVRTADKVKRVALVFTGQGAQW